MEQLIERVNKLATPVKAGIILGIIVLLTAGTYFLLVSDLEDTITSLKAQQQAQDQVLAKKQEIADNLNDRRKEMDELEQRFQVALTQLPERKDIEELLAQLNDVGKKSGLEIAAVTPGQESAQGFIASIPISMSVTGNYHEIALFLQEVGNLPRIVHVSDIKLGNPQARGDKVALQSSFLATTYRFSDTAQKKEKAAP
ncbi:MAG: type 4a pilus biogenesis protein PilO [Archangium sp.]